MDAADHPHQTATPAPDRRQATRLRIIKSAADVFGQRGFAGTSVQAILDAAGVSRRTFYQCFSDKSAVLAAIYERSLTHLYQCRREAMKHPGSGAERLKRAQAVYMDFVATAGPVVRVITTEALRPDSPLHALRLTMHQQIEDQYRAVFREAEGRDLDPLIARSIILLSESLSIHILTQHPDDPGRLQRATEVLSSHIEQLLAAD
ncbi:MAG: TetR/AcrR family transcriptional regulator [Abyssibacter sp.]|jgi:AcrR family transcriptional regulator|uniref:TetR/AcrR family transcriptional regulator n=1 Tax=Abyssibacter sp. TaxID=2320200 RepID=UPI002EB1E477|nr:TetR/AcrR family transcriptional regulator [Pseudomonadota bacterium]